MLNIPHTFRYSLWKTLAFFNSEVSKKILHKLVNRIILRVSKSLKAVKCSRLWKRLAESAELLQQKPFDDIIQENGVVIK